MSTHKNIDRICVAITVLSLLLAVLFMNGKALGLTASARAMGYENTLFDTYRVHTIDIIIDDWDAFLETATGEEYATCSLIIDNDAVKNVAIRGKGNTSLSTVSTMDSDRYSFKIEFDHYETGKTYKGLDKLCLNNLIQDNTYMKDYLAYTLMAEFGADAPLCSYVWVTVNGEDWGLYLAVEAVEDSFMERVYNGEGDLYKPDSMSMGGGGPGNGRDFNIEDFINENADAMGFPWNRSSDSEDTASEAADSEQAKNGDSFPQPPGDGSGAWPQMPEQGTDSGEERPSRPSMPFGDGTKPPDMPGGGGGGMPGGMGMGSSDVKLQYSDDDPESYSNIFGNAKSTVTDSDKARLIRSLKALSEGENLEEILDIDEVLRYFVVHNYLVNSDSYTGSMVHNYYLHEADGKLSMIPWDYNLAFGTFQSGDAQAAVNDPIDTPLSVSGDGSRPMADWIFQNEEYTQLYHQYFAAFLDEVDVEAIIDETYALIAPYVEKDPTAFCSYEEFQTGVATLRSFCELRTESVRGQLDGTIPSTDEGQEEDSSALIDASGLTLSDMGSMGGGKGGFGGPSGSGKRSDEDAQSDQNFPSPGGDFGNPPDFGQGRSQSTEGGDFRPPEMGDGSAPAFGQDAEGGAFGGFTPPGGMPGALFSPQTENREIPWTIIILSAAVFAAGLLAAILYRKRS
ncbi:MAG: CotH kinase family protein [Oscillospiraceae bacterium]|nr:CotH kinase family protein [Oscillospiraceae bacterium]